MTDPEHRDPDKPNLGQFIAAAAPDLIGVGVAGGLQLGGADPVSSGLTGIALATAMRLDVANWKRQVGRAAYTTSLAAHDLGGAEQLERLATIDDYRLELTARVLRAAARTPLEKKLPALARVLASGLPAEGDVGDALVLAAALDDLEEPHVRLLALLAAEPYGPGQPEPSDESGWAPDQLDAALPRQAAVMTALVSTLGRHGLARGVGIGRWSGIQDQTITDLGRRCLELL